MNDEHHHEFRRKISMRTLTGILAFSTAMNLSAPTNAAEPVSAAAKARASQYYEDAVNQMNDRNLESAIIQVKNALQQDPGMIAAQLLLGEAHLQRGEGAAAESALREAAAIGADESLVAVPLANALILQFKHQQLLRQSISSRLSPEIRVRLLETKARAALSINDREAAEKLLAELDQLRPDSVPALITRATMAMRDTAYDRAKELLDQATRLDPEDVGVLLAVASLDHARGRLTDALRGYDAVLTHDEFNIDARLARIGILLDLRRDGETDPDFAALTKQAKLDPRLGYLRAVKLARAGDEHGTRSALGDVADTIEGLGRQLVSSNQQLLLVAGIANFSLGNFEAAQDYLKEYLAQAPDDGGPTRMLATIQLQRREYVAAKQMLEEFLRRNGDTPQMLALLASAQSGTNNHQGAAAALERAAALDPDNPVLATRSALGRAGRGQTESALAKLAEIFNDDAAAVSGIPLAILHLNHGDIAQALVVTRKLHEGEPSNPTYLNLRAIAELGGGDAAVAKELWQQALRQDPGFLPAKLNLAKLARREGDLGAAEKGIRELLVAKPDDPSLQLELARVLIAHGNRRDALKLARDASAKAPDSFETAAFLIDLLVADQAYENAMQVAWEQEKLHPDNLYVLDAQARVRLASGDLDALRVLLRRMADLAQFDAGWLERIAGHQLAAGSLDDAHYSLFKAEQSEPQRFTVRARLVEVTLQQNKPTDAAVRAQTLLKDFPDRALAHVLAGDCAAALGAWREAAAHYAAALQRESRPEFALKLHLAYRRLDDTAMAEAVLQDWIAKRPADAWAHGALGEFHMLGGRLAPARQSFQRFLEIQPDHAPTLNNLANILLGLRDLDAALGHARRAHELQPDNPLVADTLGWSLVQAGKSADALPYLREARTRASTVPEIRYHLAVALRALGRDREALTELDEALKDAARFDGRDAAEALRTALKG